MRVGIDSGNLLIPNKTGIEVYTTELVLELVKQSRETADFEIVLYFYAGNQYANVELLDQYLSILTGIKKRVYRPRYGYRIALAGMAMMDHLDLLHIPSPGLPRLLTCPIAVTIHDLTWLHLTDEGNVKEGIHAEQNSLKKSAFNTLAGVITNSQTTKKDIIEYYGVLESLISVVEMGVDKRFQPVANSKEMVNEKYGIENYIVNVAALQYRKNQVRLLQAFAKLIQENGLKYQLVIAGRDGWGCEQVYAERERLGLEDTVKFLGYVPDEDMPAIYSGAELSVYPSILEGFGFPVVEAMACGTVTATSDTSSMPEIGGDAAVYFNPYDVDDMAEKIYLALVDEELRKSKREAGFKRAKQYTWENTARKTLEAYRKMIRS
jgi:glycosyltransferase involved in cell wall biosynthesis